MSGYSKVWITKSEAQELHLALGRAIEIGDFSGLTRAREIASIILSDMESSN